MLVIPAIDLRNGGVVRLRQGDFSAETRYPTDPVAVAHLWAEAGAAWIHVVDLDGARVGAPQQLALVARIAAAVPARIELGGGLRTEQDVRRAVEAGADRIVIGSTAAQDPGRTRRLIAAHGERLAIAIDVRDGAVQISGWTSSSRWAPFDLVERLVTLGASRFIVTDVHRDGMLCGPNRNLLSQITSAIDRPVIASGGVDSLDDLRDLATTPVEAAIVGKALYEGRFTLPAAIAAARRS